MSGKPGIDKAGRGCKVDGCAEPHWSRGFCRGDYTGWREGRVAEAPDPPSRSAVRHGHRGWSGCLKVAGSGRGVWRCVVHGAESDQPFHTCPLHPTQPGELNVDVIA